MKKLFDNARRKLSTSSTSALGNNNNNNNTSNQSTSSGFNLRRLSVNSSSSLQFSGPLTIKVLRGGYNIDLEKVDSSLFTKLHKAAYLNNEDRVRRCLDKPNKYPVNSIDGAHRTALHLAAVNGNDRVVRMLITARANVDVQDQDGKTPLIKAVECSHSEVVHTLMEYGANLDVADKNKGNTALHQAMITANLDCALYIIRNALYIDYNRRNHVSMC